MNKRSTHLDAVRFYIQTIQKFPKLYIPILTVIPITVLVTNFLPPLIVANVINRLSRHDYQPHHVWASFGHDLVGYALLGFFGGMVTWRIVDYFAWKLEANVQRDIARLVFNHLIQQSADFHANNFGGSLVSQTNKLLGGYIRIADTTLFQTLPLFWSLIFVCVLLLGRAPVYVMLLMFFSIFYIVTAILFTRRARRFHSAHAAAESKQTGQLSDAITNVMAIKSFARGRYETQRFEVATGETHTVLLKLMRAAQLQQTYFSGLTSSISALSLTMAVVGVLVYNINLATVFLILNYTSYIVGQLFQFSTSSLRQYNRALGDASDMVTTLQLKPSVLDPIEPEKVRIRRGAITFNKVVFQHDGSSDALFDNLNLSIKPGEKIGLVGHSGSGKSTFTRLLLRFSDVDSGTIEIDGQNIAHITQDDLHSHIAYVPQEPLLFHRSIKDNIAYGKFDATTADIELAAQQSHAAEFIDLLPQTYDTLVGERGVKLSGGQRQRIAIARAMLKNAPILVLDEATSALDSDSEVLIQDALWKLMEGRTAIVIAHRLSTVQKMDRIIVLEDGQIAEQGSHSQLLRKAGTYAKLWAHQSGGFIDD